MCIPRPISTTEFTGLYLRREATAQIPGANSASFESDRGVPCILKIAGAITLVIVPSFTSSSKTRKISCANSMAQGRKPGGNQPKHKRPPRA